MSVAMIFVKTAKNLGTIRPVIVLWIANCPVRVTGVVNMSYLAITFLALQAMERQHHGTRVGENYYHAMALAAANLIGENV